MTALMESIQEKMQSLSPEHLAKVDALVTALQKADLTRAAMIMSEPSFADAWDDPENDVYDAL